jgi:tetratricopeptide (TPR) repeat protein
LEGIPVVLEELTALCDALTREAKFDQAVAACDECLTGGLTSLDRCRVLLLKAGLVVQRQGKWCNPALVCLDEALELAPMRSMECYRVLALFTAAYAAQGSAEACTKTRETFLDLLQDSTSSEPAKYLPVVEFNCGLAYHECGRLPEAEAHYVAARSFCSSSQAPDLRDRIPYIDFNLIDVLLELCRFEDAKVLMDVSYRAISEGNRGPHKRNQQAIYALHTGDLDSAVLWVESGLGHPACDDRTRAALLLTKAKIARKQGHESEAQTLSHSALQLAAKVCSGRLCERVVNFMRGN